MSLQQPQGFESIDKTLVCKLHKAIYGLKQAPRAWFQKLPETLQKMGFCPNKCDPSLLIQVTPQRNTYILVYIDDILITGSSTHSINQLKHDLNREFALKDLGTLHYFLGIEILKRQDGSLHLSQKKYAQDLLLRAKINEAKYINNPMATNTKLTKDGSNLMSNPYLYRSIVGSL